MQEEEEDKQITYLKRAIIPSLFIAAVLVVWGISKEKAKSTIVLLGLGGIFIGYIVGNAGKW